MRKFYLSVLTLIVGFFAVNFMLHNSTEVAGENPFKGVQSCAMCHAKEKIGKQTEIWKGTAHSKAYQSLLTEEANKIAKEKGLTKPAAESEECLSCHVSGHNVAETLKDKKFDMKDGVQCETCHGAAGGWMTLHNKADKKDEAVAKGLIVPKKDKVEEFCKGCHNSKSPTFKEFKFEEQWAKIKHPLPEKKS